MKLVTNNNTITLTQYELDVLLVALEREAQRLGEFKKDGGLYPEMERRHSAAIRLQRWVEC